MKAKFNKSDDQTTNISSAFYIQHNLEVYKIILYTWFSIWIYLRYEI